MPSAIDDITFDDVLIAGYWKLSYDGTNVEMLFNSDATAVLNALESIPSIGSGNIAVEVIPNGFRCRFQGAKANLAVPPITASQGVTPCEVEATEHTITKDVNGSAATTSPVGYSENFVDGDESNPAVYTVTLDHQPTSGSYTDILGYGITYPDLPGSSGNWIFSGSYASQTLTWTREFNGTISSSPAVTNMSSLRYQTDPGQNAVLSVEIDPTATAGEWRLNVGMSSSSNSYVGYNALDISSAVVAPMGESPSITGTNPWQITSTTPVGIANEDIVIDSNPSNKLRKNATVTYNRIQNGSESQISAQRLGITINISL